MKKFITDFPCLVGAVKGSLSVSKSGNCVASFWPALQVPEEMLVAVRGCLPTVLIPGIDHQE